MVKEEVHQGEIRHKHGTDTLIGRCSVYQRQLRNDHVKVYSCSQGRHLEEACSFGLEETDSVLRYYAETPSSRCKLADSGANLSRLIQLSVEEWPVKEDLTAVISIVSALIGKKWLWTYNSCGNDGVHSHS